VFGVPDSARKQHNGIQAKAGSDTHPPRPNASTKISVRLTGV
jgi:hypothetical protein